MGAIRKLTEGFTETEVDDEIVIMRLDNGELFVLEGTAGAVWKLIDGTRDRAHLISALATEYAAEEDQIAADLDDLLVQLRERQLVV